MVEPIRFTVVVGVITTELNWAGGSGGLSRGDRTGAKCEDE